MKLINLKIVNGDRIIEGTDDTFKYISINGHYAIRYGLHLEAKDLFTAGTVKRLKEAKEADKIEVNNDMAGLFDNIIYNNSEYPLQDTGFYKELPKQGRARGLLQVLSVPHGFMYINKGYMDLAGALTDYTIYHLNHTLRPIVLKHRHEAVEFIITPMRLSTVNGGRFTLYDTNKDINKDEAVNTLKAFE